MENEIDFRELVLIFYRRKWVIISFLIVATFTSALVSFFIEPVYETSTTIALGRFDNETYNKAEFASNMILAKENLISNKELASIIDNYNADTFRLRLQKFKESVTIASEKETNIIRISVTHNQPKTAVKIADLLIKNFKDKSDKMYQSKIDIPQNAIDSFNKELKNCENQIIELKAWISQVDEKEGASIEHDLVLTRLRTNLNYYETQKVVLQDKIDSLNNQLLNYEPASVLEIATEPIKPAKPNKKLIIGISALLSLMTGLLTALLIEYFSKVPLKR